MSAFYNKEVGISKECISCSSQKTRCSHKRSHYRYKLLSERMSQITGCYLKCHFEDKLLSERMSQITGGHFKGHLKDKLLSERMSNITGGHLKGHLKDKLLSERMSQITDDKPLDLSIQGQAVICADVNTFE